MTELEETDALSDMWVTALVLNILSVLAKLRRAYRKAGLCDVSRRLRAFTNLP